MFVKTFYPVTLMILIISVSHSSEALATAGNQVFLDGFEDIPTLISCPSPPSSLVNGRCEVDQGDDNLLIRSHIVTPNTLYRNGELLIDAAGTIQCAACDCSAETGYSSASVLNCPDVLTTPGLINSHEHVTFQEGPVDTGSERYDHRHDWRMGIRGHTEINVSGSAGPKGTTWGEVRHLLGGATSMLGSGSADGLVRNLDRTPDRDGLDGPRVRLNTFPLGDSSGDFISSDCDNANLTGPVAGDVYNGHISVGIDSAAQNEWLCSVTALQSIDAALPGPSIVHGIAMTADDLPSLISARASLVWSPRSDIMLYGMTTPASMLANHGINMVLGTDWAVNGSMNMLREFSCALEHNETGLNGFFSDKNLLDMATKNAAMAAGVGSKIGKIAPGYLADLTLFDASIRSGYAAAVKASQEDVVLVLKAGAPMFGDATVVDSLSDQPGACDLMGDVIPGDCMAGRRLCVFGETGFTYAELKAEATGLQPLYSCGGPPADEPTCTPSRNEGDGIVYTGIPTAGDSDGDGVADATDNCPSIFNPPRPVDGFVQADHDGDDVGDVCDEEL